MIRKNGLFALLLSVIVFQGVCAMEDQNPLESLETILAGKFPASNRDKIYVEKFLDSTIEQLSHIEDIQVPEREYSRINTNIVNFKAAFNKAVKNRKVVKGSKQLLQKCTAIENALNNILEKNVIMPTVHSTAEEDFVNSMMNDDISIQQPVGSETNNVPVVESPIESTTHAIEGAQDDSTQTGNSTQQEPVVSENGASQSGSTASVPAGQRNEDDQSNDNANQIPRSAAVERILALWNHERRPLALKVGLASVIVAYGTHSLISFDVEAHDVAAIEEILHFINGCKEGQELNAQALEKLVNQVYLLSEQERSDLLLQAVDGELNDLLEQLDSLSLQIGERATQVSTLHNVKLSVSTKLNKAINAIGNALRALCPKSNKKFVCEPDDLVIE